MYKLHCKTFIAKEVIETYKKESNKRTSIDLSDVTRKQENIDSKSIFSRSNNEFE